MRGGAVNTDEEDHPHLINHQIMTVFVEQPLALTGSAKNPGYKRPLNFSKVCGLNLSTNLFTITSNKRGCPGEDRTSPA